MYERGKVVPAVLWGGGLCGVLDLTAAIVQWRIRGVSPVRIMQSIASGLLGRSAFEGGAATAALGVALHFFIALVWATVFYGLSRIQPWLLRYPVLAGTAYGVVVYFFMYDVVLPRSNFSRGPFSVQLMLIGLAVHICCVGLPISLAVRRYSR